MFISKDLNEKCYVVTGIDGAFELDHLLDKAKEISTERKHVYSYDLYRMVNPFLDIISADKVDALKDIKYWYYDYKGENFDTAVFTLYIPYQEEVKQEGCCVSRPRSMPDISSIETYNDRIVLVRFKDGTFTKAVTMDKDPFDFDMLFTIAYMKRMLGEDGHKKYHKLIDRAHKIVKKQEKDEEEKLRKKAEQKERVEKRYNKKVQKENEMDERLGQIIFHAVSYAIGDAITNVAALAGISASKSDNMEDDLK